MGRRALNPSRWWLIVAAAVAMGAAGIYQFGWSTIRLPIGARLGTTETALGTVFTLFIVFQTIGQFPAGWVRDRYGPRLPLVVATVFLVTGFVGIGAADTTISIYSAYAIGGLGVAIVYTVAVNTAIKWFDDRRGLATGIVTMAYSGVSFLAIPIIAAGVTTAFEQTVFVLAGLTGGAALLAALVLRDPGDNGGRSADTAIDDSPTGAGGYTWRETINTWQFWLLYAVFVLVNGVGLMVIGKVVTFATVLGLPTWTGPASASLVAIADAGGVLVIGGLSDRLGKVRTVATSLVLCGMALAGAVVVGNRAVSVGFVALIAAAAFFRSPPFAVFPSIVGEYYGRGHSSENYAALYTAKIWGGVIGGTIASATVVTIGWSTAFGLGAVLVAIAGVSLAFLRSV